MQEQKEVCHFPKQAAGEVQPCPCLYQTLPTQAALPSWAVFCLNKKRREKLSTQKAKQIRDTISERKGGPPRGLASLAAHSQNAERLAQLSDCLKTPGGFRVHQRGQLCPIKLSAVS